MDVVNRWFQEKIPFAHIEKKFYSWHLGEAAGRPAIPLPTPVTDLNEVGITI
jgi:hypothetical protein